MVIEIPEPKDKIITTRQVVYYAKCPLCKKEIAGRGIKGYEYNMKRHFYDKHSEEND